MVIPQWRSAMDYEEHSNFMFEKIDNNFAPINPIPQDLKQHISMYAPHQKKQHYALI